MTLRHLSHGVLADSDVYLLQRSHIFCVAADIINIYCSGCFMSSTIEKSKFNIMSPYNLTQHCVAFVVVSFITAILCILWAQLL